VEEHLVVLIRPLKLVLLPDTFAICRLDSNAAIPAWIFAGSFLSITRTLDELSVVCLQSLVPKGFQCEGGWRCLRVAGKMDFSEVGILASLVTPLADAGISISAISTFDTDYPHHPASSIACGQGLTSFGSFSAQRKGSTSTSDFS
jgi:hypothetical protein